MFLSKDAPLVAISDSDLLGPSTLKSTEEDWKATFELLSKHASMIVLMPPFTGRTTENRPERTPRGMSEELTVLRSPELV